MDNPTCDLCKRESVWALVPNWPPGHEWIECEDCHNKATKPPGHDEETVKMFDYCRKGGLID